MDGIQTSIFLTQTFYKADKKQTPTPTNRCQTKSIWRKKLFTLKPFHVKNGVGVMSIWDLLILGAHSHSLNNDSMPKSLPALQIFLSTLLLPAAPAENLYSSTGERKYQLMLNKYFGEKLPELFHKCFPRYCPNFAQFISLGKNWGRHSASHPTPTPQLSKSNAYGGGRRH